MSMDGHLLNKASLRKNVKEARKLVHQKRGKECSLLLKELILKKSTKGIVLSYASFGSELSTRSLNEALLKQKRLALPKVSEGTIIPYLILSTSCLKQGFMGILEPDASCPQVSPFDIDLVLVPSLALDLQGNRIGYGKGSYDRFLKEHPKLPTISVVYREFLMQETIQTDEHDVKVGEVACV